MLSRVKHFADSRGYRVVMLWGVTSGVSFCKFEELFSPIPGVTVWNATDDEIHELKHHMPSSEYVNIGGKSLKVFRSGQVPKEDIFSWDLRCASALLRGIPGPMPLIAMTPSIHLRNQAASFAQRHKIAQRLGIRIRVEEILRRDRKPHRVKRELDAVVRSLIRIPWYVRVFVATDSEYLQQMIASHFADTVYLPKQFDLQESTGRYIHRQDKHAMFTFLMEVECLCQCRKVVNIGGFINEHTVLEKTIAEPYKEVIDMHLHRL